MKLARECSNNLSNCKKAPQEYNRQLVNFI